MTIESGLEVLREKLKDVLANAKVLNMYTGMNNKKIGQAISHVRAAILMLEQAGE